jgi:diguanylate cyclase (GGDEF)-like protein
MTDSEKPHTPEHNGDAGPIDGPASPVPADAQPVGAPETAVPAQAPADAQPAEPAADKPDGRPGSRRALWAAAGTILAAIGIVASILGARSVAHSDASKASSSFHQNSAAIASTLTLAVQHEEDLTLSAGAFFASNPHATPAQIATWAKAVRALHRYPELERLNMISLVRAPELPAFETQLTGTPASAGASRLTVVPASSHHYYCLSAGEVPPAAAGASASAFDYCAQGPELLVARDTGKPYYPPSAPGQSSLLLYTPVYYGGTTPSSLAGRRAASAGWLRESLAPSLVLQRALRGHPENAVRLTHSDSSGAITFAAGTPVAGAQSRTIALRDGWTLESFGPAPGPGVFGDAGALALLVTGVLLSVLAGLLLFILGTRGSQPPAPARVRAPQSPQVPSEDLYDPLTGLPNRALMLDRADRMLARASRQSGMLVGALFIDIDWFKDVTDRLGQDAGDQMLKVIAERLEAVIRTHDTVGRLGGDEFVVLVESAARGARLDSLARRVIEALHKPVEIEGFGPSVSLTASIGVAFGRYNTPDDLLRDARTALIAAKAAGKDRYTVFNANMRSVVEGRGEMEIELNNALGAGQFFLLYEPVRDLTTGNVVGMEAHIRWRHPSQGVLAPADFIPLAEETGLIIPIGRWVLEEACARAAALNLAGPPVTVSVKVSASQLNRDGFVTDVRRALQLSGIEPSLLTVEVAETTVMRDIGAAADRLREIKDLGVHVAIDDFGGSGYAYHSDLRRLPLDFLKVDRSSLAATDDEDYRSWLLEAILIVGRDLSLGVIATGIATSEQVDTLAAMGCAMAQGPFIGEPVPADAIARLIESGMSATPAPTTPNVQI